MYTRDRDEGKKYQNTFSCRGEIVWRILSTPVFLQLGRVENSPTMKIVLCLLCEIGAHAYLWSCLLLDSRQYRRNMTTFLNAFSTRQYAIITDTALISVYIKRLKIIIQFSLCLKDTIISFTLLSKHCYCILYTQRWEKHRTKIKA